MKKEEKELKERMERTVDIFQEQVKRALGEDCGIFIVIGSDDNGISLGSTYGKELRAKIAMSMLICKEEKVRKFVKETLAVAERVRRSANDGR